MDPKPVVKRRRTSDCSISSASLIESSPLPDHWKAFPWNKFPGFTVSERAGRQTSWVWQHGFDIQACDSPNRRKWVCRPCLQMPKPKRTDFSALGTQNIEKHLYKEHRLVDESGKRQPALVKRLKEKTPALNIVQMLNLDTDNPKEQAIANALIQRFDKDRFQRLLLEWVVDANISFRQPEHWRLRRVFEYLNPSVAATNAHISHNTVRQRIVDLHLRHKSQIINHLKAVPGQIHIAFDGWRSRNRHALYGVVCFYINNSGSPSKLVLGLPELKISHSGDNVAAQIVEILESYEILEKVGYITLDNAANMDTAAEEVAEKLGLDPKKRRVRCFGHVLNLVVKALLFGHKSEAFEAEVDGEPGVDAAQHEIWRKKGPIGKLHNLVHWIHRSDKLTYRLRALQEEFFQRSDSPKTRARKPLDVVRDNQTRWLSTFYMMRRSLKLRPFLEDLVEKTTIEFNRERRNGMRRKEDLPMCLHEESLLSEKDWVVIELMEKVLIDFEEALRMLEGDAQRRVRKGGRVEAYGNMWDVASTFSYDGRTLGGTAAQIGGFDNWLRCSAGSGLGLLPKSRDEFLSPFSTEELEAYYFKYCQHLFAQEHISRRDYAKDMLVDALKQLPKVFSVQYTSRSTDIGERVPSLSSLSHVARQTLAEPESYHGYLEKERRFWILLQSVWLSGHSRWLESVHGSDLDLKRWNDTAKSFVRCYTALPALQRLSLEFEFAQHGDGETTQLASMVAHASSLTELRLSFDDFSFDNPHAVINLPQVVISSETRWKNLRSLSLQAVVASEGCLRHLLGKHSQSLRSVELSNIRLHSADPPDQFGRGSWISFIQFLNETLSLDRIRFDGCFSNGWDEGWISRDADWERRVYGGDIVPPPYPDDCLKYRIGRFITHDGPCPFTARGGQSDDADYDYHQLPWVFEEDRSWHFEYRLIQ